ncbi:hypothetical protein BZG05_08165 [Salinivibrio kushneri]|uniref:DUF1240 domain-containing protein n=1 Tax=Salinivibrio kushneri TaxID=1908198 RepID=UPI0009CA095D|nr:DUF1240 domain-containing protein [Salinivibrio kushneri]OOE34415.1 hypothetical protein BZG05_08165 [Salinivibrio kushneri]
MNQQLARVLSIVFSLFFIWLAFFLGLVNEIIKPFVVLPERIKLYAHLNYVFLLIAPVFFGWVTFISIHQALNSKRDRVSYGRWWRYAFITVISIAVLSLTNRIYLGYRVDQAGYVKCAEESRTSAKSSWRVYAKDLSLCKSSSGIAGG